MEIKKYSGKAIDLSYKQNRKIEYIVLHYTAGVSNKSESTNLNICKYWDSSSSKASADFVVDEDDIYQYNKDIRNYYTYHCGGNKYNYIGGARLYGKCTNSNSIGIEMCSFRQDGNAKASVEEEGWEIGDRSIALTKELVDYLKKEYNIPNENIITHFDVTGKLCPRPFLMYENKVWKLKDEFYTIFELKREINMEEQHWTTIHDDNVDGEVLEVYETLTNLNCRKEPNTNAEILFVYNKGVLLDVFEKKDGWLRTRTGWVSGSSSYSRKVADSSCLVKEEPKSVNEDSIKVMEGPKIVSPIHSLLEAFLGRVRDIYRENVDKVTYELYRYNPDNKEMEIFCISKDIYLFESMKFIFGQIDTKSLGKYVTLIDEEGSAYILTYGEIGILTK